VLAVPAIRQRAFGGAHAHLPVGALHTLGVERVGREVDVSGGEPNERLASAMRAAGLSQKALARAVRELSAAQGAPVGCDHTAVSRWLTGTQPRAGTVRLVAEVFAQRLGRPMDAGDLGFQSVTRTAPVSVAVDVVESWELVDALSRSSIGQATLAELDRVVFGYAARYPSTAPNVLLPDVRRLLVRVKLALGEPQPVAVRRRCVMLLGVLTGMAGSLMLDLGQPEHAFGMFSVGRLAGAEAEDADLTAWVVANASIGAFYSHRPGEAAQLLAEADALAAGSGPRRRSWVSAMRARALAGAGQTDEARRALEQAYTLIAAADAPAGGNDFFDAARLDGIAGGCLLRLGDSAGAGELLSDSLARRSLGDAKGRALITLDLAACRVLDGDADEAVELAGGALELARGAIVRPIVERASQLRDSMESWAPSRALAELDARLYAAAAR
jgi:transcriptional regulator with XRE-family HTH domain